MTTEETRETEIRSVRHDFSEKEKRDLATTVVEKNLEVEDLEVQKKAATSSFKDRIDSALLDARTAGRKYRDGFELRDVEVEVFRDYENGIIFYIRIDTGESVESREMTPQEKQMRLEDATA